MKDCFSKGKSFYTATSNVLLCWFHGAWPALGVNHSTISGQMWLLSNVLFFWFILGLLQTLVSSLSPRACFHLGLVSFVSFSIGILVFVIYVFYMFYLYNNKWMNEMYIMLVFYIVYTSFDLHRCLRTVVSDCVPRRPKLLEDTIWNLKNKSVKWVLLDPHVPTLWRPCT